MLPHARRRKGVAGAIAPALIRLERDHSGYRKDGGETKVRRREK